MANNHMTPRKFFAKEIKLAREAKGMRVEELGSQLHVSVSLIRMWERGDRIPVPRDLEKIEEFFGLNGVLRRMRDELVDAAVPVEWFGEWVAIEEKARFLLSFEPLLVPGLLQTPEYARVVSEAADLPGDVEEMVARRLERQLILSREYDAPTLIAVMDESVLYRKVGDSKIMCEQMRHLLEMMKLRNVIINIVPLESEVCASFLSGYVIANFARQGDMAYVDNQLDGDVIEDPDHVARLRRMFESARGAALTTEESANLIRKAIEKWTA